MVVLKGVPRILSPELLFALGRMGHGDEIVLADANFPSYSIAKHGPELIQAHSHGCVEILKGVLKVFPLDTYIEFPIFLMDRTDSDKERNLQTPVWDEYKDAVDNSEGKPISVKLVERFEFYQQSKKAFAIVCTGETALYGNIILRKGVL